MTEGGLPAPVCVRHPDRETRLACTRCGRPACPECLREAAVGYQCVDCVAAGLCETRQVRPALVAWNRDRVLQRLRMPYLTYLLIAANVAAFAATAAQAHSMAANDDSALFVRWALWPPAVAHGELGRIVGAAFLHFGPIHLLANMFALYVVGRSIEAFLGSGKYLALYTVSMLGSAATVMLFSTHAITAGASGAIFGLFGAELALLMVLRQSPAPVLAVIAFNVILSFSIPGISIWGHLGGLAAGTLAGFGMLYGPRILKASAGKQADLVSWAAVLAVGALSVTGIAVGMLRILN
ncbi:MAG: rhomboid family intramembrane serine protease [Mycobacteriaceae bacterium]|nr:rhomboid family intramembrane serine protease [Mycobacteriaceae bacterium]